MSEHVPLDVTPPGAPRKAYTAYNETAHEIEQARSKLQEIVFQPKTVDFAAGTDVTAYDMSSSSTKPSDAAANSMISPRIGELEGESTWKTHASPNNPSNPVFEMPDTSTQALKYNRPDTQLYELPATTPDKGYQYPQTETATRDTYYENPYGNNDSAGAEPKPSMPGIEVLE